MSDKLFIGRKAELFKKMCEEGFNGQTEETTIYRIMSRFVELSTEAHKWFDRDADQFIQIMNFLASLDKKTLSQTLRIIEDKHYLEKLKEEYKNEHPDDFFIRLKKLKHFNNYSLEHVQTKIEDKYYLEKLKEQYRVEHPDDYTNTMNNSTMKNLIGLDQALKEYAQMEIEDKFQFEKLKLQYRKKHGEKLSWEYRF